MFLLRNRIIANFVRHRRDIFNKQSRNQPANPQQNQQSQLSQDHGKDRPAEQAFEYIPPASYPYKFGGFEHISCLKASTQQSFSRNKTDFFAIYISLLKAIQSKNKSSLSKLVEASMVDPLMNSEIKSSLVNSNSKGRILPNSMTVGVGATFSRKNKVSLMRMMGDQSEELRLYVPKDKNQAGMMTGGGISFLISYQVTILSEAKLTPGGHPESTAEEAHIIDFEHENIMTPTRMMSMMAKLPALEFSSDPEAFRSFLISEDAQWKVGNVDKFLKSRWE